MRALTVEPRVAGSARVEDVPDPQASPDQLVVEVLAVGVCGTDREIVDGRYGRAPQGRRRLVLGHESLGRVLRAPEDCELARGDLVVGIVRRPDPVPCASCAIGEWDMCENGMYTERGIDRLDGYASERVALEPAFAIAVPPRLGELGVLLEPASVVAKAWEQIERIAARAAAIRPRRVLVTGAGPIGLLAALIGVERGYDVSVLDRAARGPKAELVRALGARYHAGSMHELPDKPQIIVECTGSSELVVAALSCSARNGIVCLTGISSGARVVQLSAARFSEEMVLENDVVFGSVNANRRHYLAALEALRDAPDGFLARVISRRVPLERFELALERQPDDVKVVWTLA